MVLLDGSLSYENDGDIVGYRWKQTKGSPPVILSEPIAIQPEFVAPDVAKQTDLVFKLAVKDSQSLESQAVTVVTVVPAMKGDTEKDGDGDGIGDACE
jgi:K319-like protein